MATKKQKQKFDAEYEALKILVAEEKSKLGVNHVKSETPKRKGGRVIVTDSKGNESTWFYVESGMFKGWNEEP